MMKVIPDTRDVVRKTQRLIDRTPVATAQELNAQLKQSKTQMKRGIANTLSITPQKRVSRRIILPRGGKATPRKLRALGLSLVETMPAHWFHKGGRGRKKGRGANLTLNAGAKPRNNRTTRGRPFVEKGRGGKTLVFRRVDPPRPRESGDSWLPIQAMMIDTEIPGYAVRRAVLAKLASEWSNRWVKRMRREIKRAFR